MFLRVLVPAHPCCARLKIVKWLLLLMLLRYWDSSYDEDLMEDRVAMNLLFLQVVCHLYVKYQEHFVAVSYVN